MITIVNEWWLYQVISIIIMTYVMANNCHWAEVQLHLDTDAVAKPVAASPPSRAAMLGFFDAPDPVVEAAAVKIQAMERGRQERKRLKELLGAAGGWDIFDEKIVSLWGLVVVLGTRPGGFELSINLGHWWIYSCMMIIA